MLQKLSNRPRDSSLTLEDNLLDRFSTKDRFAHYYATFLATENGLVREHIIATIPQGRVLNVGCGGNGTERTLFPRPAYQIFGADVNAEDLYTLQHKQLYDGLYNASITSLPFEPGSFDIVYLRLVLHHLIYPENLLAKGLEECFRVLKSHGILALVEPNSWHPVGALMNIAHQFGIDAYIHGTDDDIALSPLQLQRLMIPLSSQVTLHTVTYNWRRLPLPLQIGIDTAHTVMKKILNKIPYFGHTFMMIAHKG